MKDGKIILTFFEMAVLDALKKVPRGRVTTYKELAKGADRPRAARAVGNAVNKNPFAPKIPCHRVVKSDGGIGGYAAGVNKKIDILKKEGIIVKNNKILNFKKILFKF